VWFKAVGRALKAFVVKGYILLPTMVAGNMIGQKMNGTFGRKEMKRVFLTVFLLTAGIFLVGCEKHEPRVPRKLFVGKDYDTVQEAIDAAKEGDTVAVRVGLYKERIRLKSGVTVAGMSRDKVILEADATEGPVVTIEGCRDVKLERITARQVGATDEMGKDKSGYPAVLVRNSKAQIRECRVEASGDCGITIDGGSECEVSGCISNDNKRSGVMAVGEGTKVTIERNVCVGNKVNGIYLKEDVRGQLKDNDCADNEASGISAVNCSHNIVIEDSNCSKNSRCVIYVEKLELVTVANNSCRSNGWSGIILEQTHMGASVKANNCSENQYSGIYLDGKGYVSVSRNICSGNGWHGISIADEKGHTGLVENCCIRNERYGIWYSVRVAVRDKNNICELNGYVHFGEIRSLLEKKDFAELEKIAGRMRDNRLRFANGNWQLDEFYGSFAQDTYRYEESPEQYLGMFQEWIAQYPKSVTPRIALAGVYVGFGWRARGGGWAYEVTEEGWEKLKSNLEKALPVAMGAEQLGGNDPVLYKVYLQAGLGLGSSAEQMDTWLEKGLAIEPEYLGLYTIRAIALMPRWGGEDRELEAFARKVTEQTEQKWRQSLYAVIAAGLLPMHSSQGYETFLKHKFDYEKLKQGHEDLLERYPEASFYVNTYCIFASIYQDKQKARELFDKIGENWDISAWCEEEHFKKFRDWAYEGKDVQKVP